MKTSLTKFKISPQQFVEAITKLASDTENVCRMLVSLVDDIGPKVYDQIIKLKPTLNYNLLGNLERVGRGQLYHGLLFDSSPGARKALALPPALQRQVYENPVKIIENVNGKSVLIEKPIQQLTVKQANLLIDASGKIRSVEEQMLFVTSTSTIPSRRAAQRYQLTDGKLVVGDTEFDIPTIRDILSRLESEALRNLPSAINDNQLKPK